MAVRTSAKRLLRLLNRIADPLFLRNLRTLRDYVPPATPRSLLVVALFSFVAGILEAVVVVAIGSAVAALQSASTDSGFDMPFVGEVGGATLLVVVWTTTVLALVVRWIALHISTAMSVYPMAQIRLRLVSAYFSTSLLRQRAERLGELGDLLVNQTPRVGLILSNVAATVAALTVLGVLVACAVVVDPLTFVTMIAAVLVASMVALPLQRLVRQRGATLSAAMLDYSSEAAEYVSAAQEVRLFDADDVVTKRLSRSSDVTVDVIRRLKVFIELSPAAYLSVTIAMLLSGLITLSALGVRSVAEVGIVTLLLLRATFETQLVHRAVIASNEHLPFFEEIRARVDRYEATKVERGTAHLTAIESVTMRNISFVYGEEPDADEPVLKGLDLDIVGGERIGIRGPSGEGKTTLLALLLGLLEPTDGSLLVNGQPPRDYSASSWARQISAVGQQPHLIRASVAENIRFFRDWVSDEDLRWAASAAGIDEEIMRWPDAYDTLVGTQGSRRLSGGQSQRVALARALAGRPSLLILDEPTSALDAGAEGVVVDSLAALGDDCSVVIVSHRDATLTACDRVLEMSGGTLSER